MTAISMLDLPLPRSAARLGGVRLLFEPGVPAGFEFLLKRIQHGELPIWSEAERGLVRLAERDLVGLCTPPVFDEHDYEADGKSRLCYCDDCVGRRNPKKGKKINDHWQLKVNVLSEVPDFPERLIHWQPPISASSVNQSTDAVNPSAFLLERIMREVRKETRVRPTKAGCFSVRLKTKRSSNHKLKDVKGFDCRPEKFNGEIFQVYSCMQEHESNPFDEVFQPTEEQLKEWREEYSINGEFKKFTYPRLEIKDSGGEARVQEDTNSWIASQCAGRSFEEMLSTTNISEKTLKQIFLKQSLPAGYPKPVWLQYSGMELVEEGVWDALDEAAQSKAFCMPSDLKPPRNLDPSTFACISVVQPNQMSRIWYPMPVCDVQRMKRYRGENAWSDVGQVEAKRRQTFLGSLANVTKQEKDYTEDLLSGKLSFKPDYDPKLHEKFGHFYEYNFQYHHFDWWEFDYIFDPNKNTSVSKTRSWDEALTWNDDLIWNEAIKNTIEGLDYEDTVDGWYAMHKISEMASLRAYLVLKPEPMSEFVQDYVDDAEPAYPQGSLVVSKIRLKPREKFHEVPIPSFDIPAQIRETVGGMDITSRTPETVMGNLRDLVRAGEVRYIRFAWSDVHGVSWEVY
jgi:hypothetical protein